ncbi:hypothetical protein T492DRAFT_871682 [Pavlovales sp. CCMP2436]|nr:hypothetical protein T492DRAFT_871682 [Pavlovales sp. CCMP2436]
MDAPALGLAAAVAVWGAAVCYTGAQLAWLEWRRAKLRAAAPSAKRPRPSDEADGEEPKEDKRDPLDEQPPAADGKDGWTVVTGEDWEGTYWWRESDRLADADSGQASVYAGWSERHARRVCIKVAKRGGQLFNDRVVWAALQATGNFPGGGLPWLHAHLRNVGPDALEALAGELCGPSVNRHLALAPGGRFSAADALLLGAEVLRLVSCCHARGYAHRDISPANLLLPRGGQAAHPDGALLRLVDFGISERLPTSA